jgi:hypothetical protein
MGMQHKSHYGAPDPEFCSAHGLDQAAHRYVCNRDHVHDTPKEATACNRLDLLTDRPRLDTENAPDSTV